MVFGLEPLFSLVRELPGFGVVHNTRFTILYLLCMALLAGWGLDELSAASRPAGPLALAARLRRRRSSSAGRLHRGPRAHRVGLLR